MNTATYTCPELPYAYNALEPIYSAETLELHHDRHHAAYVKGANSILEQLEESRAARDFGAINQLQKSLAFNLSGHVLHSILWYNMNPEGGGVPTAELGEAIDAFFGSFDAFKDHLTQAALSLQGSGWATLAWDPLGKRLLVEQVYDHQGNIGNGTLPLLVLDMWEHAYYLQYKNIKSKWVDAFWDVIYWPDVSERLHVVRDTSLHL